MARMVYKGPQKLADMLELMGDDSEKIAKVALYDGVRAMADALVDAIEALPDASGPRPYAGLLPEDKEDMIEGLGVASFDSNGDVIDTHITIDGYARRTEKHYPNGVPLAMLARSLESGSSVRKKHPFVRPAANAAKTKVLAAIDAKMNEQIEEYKKMMR